MICGKKWLDEPAAGRWRTGLFGCAKELAHIAGVYEMEDWMMIDDRAEHFRPLLNDEYGNLFLGELVGFISCPSQKCTSIL